jgi:hypothetical protein
VEKCNEGPRIAVVTRGGARMGDNVKNGGKQDEKSVRNSVGSMQTSDPQQEKNTYQREKKEVLEQYWGASTSSVPHVGDPATF